MVAARLVERALPPDIAVASGVRSVSKATAAARSDRPKLPRWQRWRGLYFLYE
jgi:hypothetical protein